MKKRNKVVIVLIIIIILLLIAGAAFAYVYLATDLLRSDAELFGKYLSQITAEDGFIDKNIGEFQEKKKQTPYENSGQLTVIADLPEEVGTGANKVNDLLINFSGKSDAANNKVEKDVEIDYGNGITFPVTYKQDNDTYGLKISRVSSKFVAIRNENLKELAQKIGLHDVSVIPDKIEFTGIKEKIEFTQEELDQLNQIYSAVLEEQLTQENFSREKASEGEIYILELSGEQLKNVIIKMLETTEQNTLLIDKVNQLISQISQDADSIDTGNIEELIEDINEVDVSDISNLKITLGQKNKILNQIIIEYGNNKIEIIKSNNGTQLGYEIKVEIDNADNLYDVGEIGDAKFKLYLNMQYTGLQALSNVQESYQIGFETSQEDENYKYEYNIDNDVQFKETVTIESFDSNTTVFLNDHEGNVIMNFVMQLGEKILKVNKEQMQELGLEEDENPLIYSTPITMLRVTK